MLSVCFTKIRSMGTDAIKGAMIGFWNDFWIFLIGWYGSMGFFIVLKNIGYGL